MSMGVSYRPKFATRPFRPNDQLTAIYMRVEYLLCYVQQHTDSDPLLALDPASLIGKDGAMICQHLM